MLSKNEVNEIKEHLENAQNPLFFFDNDPDGLCSFLLLQRYLGRGRGIAVKSFPDLTVDYFRKVKELNADYIFILDKALVSMDFFKEARKVNIPIVYIDHHEVDYEIPEYVFYYNPSKKENSDYEPVSSLCYQVTGKKSDIWIATIGCISDSYIPDFYDEFKEFYPDLTVESRNVLDIYHTSLLGKIGQMLGAGLKDKTTNVIIMLKFLMKVKTPYEILEENSKNYTFHRRFAEIDKKYQELLERAKIIGKNSGKILFFYYGGNLSISSEIANGLKQKFPDKIIVVGYIKGTKVNISVRGDKIREKVLKAIEGMEGATGGGHEDAVGAKIKFGYWETFKKNMVELIEK